MFHHWRNEEISQGRQDESDKNPFFEWLQTILGITTTTPAPPLTPPQDCPQCSCGKINNNRIVGGSETGVNQYPWMAMLLYSNRFYCGASLINDRYVLGENKYKIIYLTVMNKGCSFVLSFSEFYYTYTHIWF